MAIEEVSIRARDVEARLECLRLALQAHGDPVINARRFYDFIRAAEEEGGPGDGAQIS
jgi:hypothetical protein